jgi:hypothetical protein
LAYIAPLNLVYVIGARGVSDGPADTRVLPALVTGGWKSIGEIDPVRQERAIFRRPKTCAEAVISVLDADQKS